jgi:tRNA(adenine34) deaminase
MRQTSRRAMIAVLAGAIAYMRGGRSPAAAASEERRRGFIDAAFAMRREAEHKGDQPYGAVVVRDDAIVGWGPSRVVSRNDATAHAEREAIRDAQARLRTRDLSGCQMYSTSRPCPLCERAAAEAGIGRMFYGEGGADAGAPRR